MTVKHFVGDCEYLYTFVTDTPTGMSHIKKKITILCINAVFIVLKQSHHEHDDYRILMLRFSQ